MPTTFSVEFDWNQNGTWVDESSELLHVSLKMGMAEGAPITDVVAQTGRCTITLDNSTQRYSPEYNGGALYGKLLPRRPVRVRATDGVTTWTLFRGYVERIAPEAGPYSQRRAVIHCVDALALLHDQKISMEWQQGKRADQLIAAAVNLTFEGSLASGTVTLTSNSLDGQTVTINGRTYTFKTTLTIALNEIQIGTTSTDTAANLKAAINGEGALGTNYSVGTEKLAGVIATAASNVITITATLPGTQGNSIGLTSGGAGVSVSGSSLAGGADAPAGLFSYQPGTEAFDLAGDKWTSDQTAALDAIREAAYSDQGRFFVQRNGVITYYDRKWFFRALPSALALNAAPFEMEAESSIERVYNVVLVSIHPRLTLGTLDVLARATTSIKLPPASAAAPKTKRIVMHFRDNAGNTIGATSVVVPLIASTDYNIGSLKGASDFNASPQVRIDPVELKASQITVPFVTSATLPLYVTNLQVRGKAVTAYDPIVQVQEDAASQTAYQKRTLSLDLSLSADETFAESLAYYLLDRYKAPFTDVRRITIRNVATVGAVNVFSVDLFNVLTVTDSQIGLNGAKCLVTGIELEIAPEGFTLHWLTTRADDRSYWLLGRTGYGELNTATRLAV